MTDETNPTTDTTQTTPATPLDPAMVTMKVVPPIVPLSTWTWNSPVIPTFYWNVYSAEQRIRQICMEIGRIEAYLDYFGAYANRAHGELNKRIDVLTAKLTEEVNRLDKRIDEENEARKAADELLQKGLDAETARAKAAEQVLQSNIDTVQSNLDNEATIRKNADDKLANDLNTESANRVAGDKLLQEHLDAEATRAKNAEKANADAIAQETTDRTSADRALQSNIDANKTAADEADKRLQDSIDTEIANRKNGDNTLTESIANEASARADADKTITGRLDGEAKTRADADTALTKSVNQRLIPTNVKAAEGSHLTVATSVSEDDPNDTTVTLGDTFDADFTALDNKVTDLEGKLTHETSDRETADNTLTAEVNKRLTADKVLAGANITVTPDPDATTVTIAANVPDVSNKLESVATADNTLVGDGTSANPLKVNLANNIDQTDTNVAYVRPAGYSHYLGIKAGDGLTAYNIDQDPDQGSGIRLSDHVNQLLEDSEKALKNVSTDSGIVGDGTAGNPIKANLQSYDDFSGSYASVRTSGEALVVPVADTSQPGVVRPDGTTITVDSAGVIKAVGGGTSGIDKVTTDNTLTGTGTSDEPLKVNYRFKESYGDPNIPLYHDVGGHPVLPIAGTMTGNGGNKGLVKILKSVEDSSKGSDIIRSFDDTGALRVLNATNDTAGAVKPDGSTITVDADGTIHAVTSGTSGLDKVTVDGTLTGDGTSAHPLGVSETIVANSTAGSTALQVVHHDDTLTGTGTDSDTLKVEHAIRIHQIEYMLESTESIKDITGGYYNGWKSGVFKANGETGLEDGTEIAIGILPIMLEGGVIIPNQYPTEAGQPFNLKYDASSVIVPMQRVPGDPKFTATVISIKIK